MKCEFPIRNIYAWLGGRLSPTVIEFQSAEDLNIFWSKLKIRLRRMMVCIGKVKEPSLLINMLTIVVRDIWSKADLPG